MTAQLHITLGLHLDGQRALPPGNTLGEAVVGPLGLLTILETQLGLLAEHPSRVERVVQYQGCLRRVDSASRFYHRSFATDALGAAATLLDWRDQWHLAGWNGTMPSGAPVRLADMAEVEELAREAVAPGVGERLACVLHALAVHPPALHAVLLLDPLEYFPSRWQAVLARLPTTGPVSSSEPQGRGFLAKLQRGLQMAVAGEAVPPVAWEQDGSFVVARAESCILAGSWVAAQLCSTESGLLVAPAAPGRLDAALHAAGGPYHGLAESSTARPALQVLPLVLELLWAPLNFDALYQFLTHPICPISPLARRLLAEKIAERPGTGGVEWDAALARADEHYGSGRSAAVRKSISYWLESERFPAETGAPVGTVLARVEALIEFFRTRLATAESASGSAYTSGFSQCHACANSLHALLAQGVSTMSPRQLQQLVELATAHGVANSLLAPEVGAQCAITHPGAAVAVAEHVTWWQLAAPVPQQPYPWSKVESGVLEQAGVNLPGTGELLAREATNWLRPVLAAQRQLVLVLPPAGQEVHPLWQMIEAITTSPVVHCLEDLLREPSTHTAALEPAPLPARKRWWHLGSGITVAARELESYSSLQMLVMNPYQWLLKYPAKLRASRTAMPNDEFRVQGNLAHRLVEQLVQRPDALTLTDAGFDAWFAERFPALVTEEAATLLAPGKRNELEGFRFRLRRAVRALQQHLAQAEVIEVVPEMHLEGSFPPGRIGGFADLVLRREGGAQAIVDMKWAGARGNRKRLRASSHMQLAIYAALLQQRDGYWPDVAYLVLRDALLLAPDARYFPGAEAVPAKSGETVAETSQRILASWAWRLEQAGAGLFEVAFDDIEPTAASEPPATALAADYLDPRYNEYRHLAGYND